MLVVFDLDGTLVDSSRALLQAHDAAFASVGRVRPADEAILELVGLPLLQTMEKLAPDLDARVLVTAYSAAYLSASVKHERLFEGIRELLSKPFRAAVATGKSQRGAERAVKQHGFARRFEVVLGADSVARPKPHPDLLHAIMDTTGTRELIMVGDTTYDLEMAHKAGVRAIGVAWGHHTKAKLQAWAPVVESVEALGRALGLFVP